VALQLTGQSMLEDQQLLSLKRRLLQMIVQLVLI
jgi:hypothetical protein